MQTTNNNYGMTLLEVMAVASIIIIALSAMLAAAVGLFKNTVFSGDFLTATNLAREGIEVIRNQRDDNFLAEDTWNSGFDFEWANIKLDLAGGFTGNFFIEEAPYNMDECLVNRNCRIYFDAGSGLYGDSSMVVTLPNAEATKYYRLLQLVPILCNFDMAGSGLCVEDDDQPIGASVYSVVKWYRNDKLQEVIVKTDLYNWQ